MADNPHDLENLIKGATRAQLTGKQEGGIVDKISQLRRDYSTGNSQNLHAIEKAIKEYNKAIANHFGDQSVRNATGTFFTDELHAGFKPKTITGFIDNKKNINLFDFLSKQNSGYFYSMRKVNPDYTGYACQIYREFDSARATVEYDSNGFVTTGSKVTVLAGDEGFGTGFFHTGNYTDHGRTGTLLDFIYPIASGNFQTYRYSVGLVTLYPQLNDVSLNETTKFIAEPQSTVFKVRGSTSTLYDHTFDNDFSEIEWQIASGRSTFYDGGGSHDHIHPVWSGINNGQYYWFYKNDFGSYSPYGKRWVIVKRQTDPTTGTIPNDPNLRAYSQILDSTAPNTPYSSDHGEDNWHIRESGTTTSDETPRETMRYDNRSVASNVVSTKGGSRITFPRVKYGQSNALEIRNFPGGSLISPEFYQANMSITGDLDLGGGSIVLVADPKDPPASRDIVLTAWTGGGYNIRGEYTHIVFGTHALNDAETGRGFHMFIGESFEEGYTTRERSKQHFYSGTITSFSDDFGDGNFNQTIDVNANPSIRINNSYLLEMHNTSPEDLGLGVTESEILNSAPNEFYINNVKATIGTGFNGFPVTGKLHGILSNHKYNIGGGAFGTNSFEGNIHEWYFFQSDPKNLETERRRYLSDITGFYQITPGKDA